MAATTTPGDQRRRRVVERAVQVASVEGLENATLGRLGSDLGMSKSSVQALFPSKQELQMAVIAYGHSIFAERVTTAGDTAEAGLPRVIAVLDAWIGCQDLFDGGCFYSAVSHEFDARPGPVRDVIAANLRLGLDLVSDQLRLAQRLGELRPETDIDQLVFELHGVILESNLIRQLLNQPEAPDRARRAIRERLTRTQP